MRIAIIGAGLAGTSAAYFLSQAGAQCSVFDQAEYAASGASGNVMGLYNPRFFAEYNAEAQFYARAFLSALDVFEMVGTAARYHPIGALHLMNNEQKQKRYPKMLKSWGWDEDLMQIISADRASEIAGIEIAHDALYLPRSGMISPRLLCDYYLRASGAVFHSVSQISDIKDLTSDYDAVVLASGYGVHQFDQTKDLPIRPVRGQVTCVKSAGTPLSDLSCVLCYGGYATPEFDQMHVVGSTFDRGVDSNEIKAEDHTDNLQKLYKAVPSIESAAYGIVGERASVRVTASGHMPIIGQIDDGLYISAAHGSHGILSSLMGAQILTAQITGQKQIFLDEVLSLLSPHRFSC